MAPKKYLCSKLQLDTFVGIQKSVVWEFERMPLAGAYLWGDIRTCPARPPLGAEGFLLPRPPPRMEKLVSGYCALRKVKGKF